MVYMTNIYNSKWHIVNIFFQIESKSVYGKSSQFTSLALAVYSMIKSPSIFSLFKYANEKLNDTHGYLISTYNVIHCTDQNVKILNLRSAVSTFNLAFCKFVKFGL